MGLLNLLKGAGLISGDYKSDLMDDIINCEWESSGESQKSKDGVHKITFRGKTVIYEKANIGKLEMEFKHVASEKLISRFLDYYHIGIITVNPSDDLVQLFSGMDISNRVFTYGEKDIEFGDLAYEILNNRPPRYVYLSKRITADKVNEYKDLLGEIVFVECDDESLLKQGLFPNFEIAYIYSTSEYINNEFEEIESCNVCDYLKLMPPRGQHNKR
jgi:hypothetical protein